MRALITRPREDAELLAKRLRLLGIESLIDPLIEIAPRKDAAPDLDGVQALLFTSANGVRAFSALSARRDLKVLTVGDGSAQAAREAGFTDVTSAGGNVDALAALVADRLRPADGILLHAGGSTLAGDLQGRLDRAGFKTRLAVLYDAIPATSFAPELRMNLNLGGIDLVLFFSPRSARIFADLWRREPTKGGPTQNSLAGLDRIRALCLSKAVAREIAGLGWARIETAQRPDLDAMLDLVAAERERSKAEMDETTKGDEPTERPAASSVAGSNQTPNTKAPNESSAGRRGGPGPLVFLLGLVAGALAGAGMIVSAPAWQKLLPPPFQARMPDVGTEIAPLRIEIDALKAQMAERATAEALAAASAEARSETAALKDEIGKWKTELAAMGEAGQAAAVGVAAVDLAPLEARLAALEARSAELARSLAAPAPGVPEGLEARLAALEAGAREIEANVQKMAGSDAEAVLRRQRAAALVLVIGELRASILGSGPFAPALAAAHDLATADPDLAQALENALAPLRPLATTGVPTLAQLQASFPAQAIAQAAEADMAGRTLGAEAGWLQQMLNRLAELVTIRPVGDIAGESALAALARAEARLGAGDLAAAVVELGALSSQAASVAQPWLDQAEARLTLDAVSDSLAALSVQSLAPAAAPDASSLGN